MSVCYCCGRVRAPEDLDGAACKDTHDCVRAQIERQALSAVASLRRQVASLETDNAALRLRIAEIEGRL